MARLIPLTKGYNAIVDDQDYEYLMQWKWYYDIGYAARKPSTGKIWMHRLLCVTNQQVDHIDGNRLNNRRNNLRSISIQDNKKNRFKSNLNTSGYKGVSWSKSANKWLAQIQCDGQHYYIGIFKYKEDAAEAYNEKALELFGKYAKLNEVRK